MSKNKTYKYFLVFQVHQVIDTSCGYGVEGPLNGIFDLSYEITTNEHLRNLEKQIKEDKSITEARLVNIIKLN